MSKHLKPLRVGFDLDGVLLYNPARIIRPLLKTSKSLLFRQKKTTFFIPQTYNQKLIWNFVHKSSLFIAPGFKDIKKLVQEKKIEAYIITARFDCLKKDYDRWLKRLNKDKTFKNNFYNHKNQQPHKYKRQMLSKLKLDIFVEDNWDIVSHLNYHPPKPKRPKVMWVSNIFDKPIKYKNKYPSLKKAMEAIRSITPQ